jgi:hypothetical protein
MHRFSDPVGPPDGSRKRRQRCCLPSLSTTSAPQPRVFRGSIAGLHAPLSTLRCALTGHQRMTRGHPESLIPMAYEPSIRFSMPVYPGAFRQGSLLSAGCSCRRSPRRCRAGLYSSVFVALRCALGWWWPDSRPDGGDCAREAGATAWMGVSRGCRERVAGCDRLATVCAPVPCPCFVLFMRF